MGGGAKPRSSEELVGGDWYEQLKNERSVSDAERAHMTPEERARGRKNAFIDLLGALPVTGNLMAAADAGDEYAEARAAFREGDSKQGVIHGGLTALNVLGALSPLPWGKAAGRAAKEAKDTANVFVPVGRSDPAVKLAEDMRDANRTNREVWDATKGVGGDPGGRFFDPSGKLMKEIPDAGMKLKLEGRKAGDTVRLNDIVEHPELFERMPRLVNTPVHLSDAVDFRQTPVMRTRPDGSYDVSLAAGDPRQGLAKNMQYSIAQQEGLPRAFRHRADDMVKDMSFAMDQMRGVDTTDRAVRDAMTAYIDKVAGTRQAFQNDLALVDPRKAPNLAGTVAAKNAGNLNSTVVQGRAGAANPEEMAGLYPYSKRASYRNRRSAGPEFEDVLALPPVNATAKELEDFLLEWRRFGSGRPLPAPVATGDPWFALRNKLRAEHGN